MRKGQDIRLPSSPLVGAYYYFISSFTGRYVN